ncbi:sensor domain-containing diguanylate cyclase [Alteromonas sp. A081]|uniref:sensor domain-containing diguanylate cyclase n=1 Tax=Alteromonas sp. A081 TaxID=3410269 RepID=UPI003B98248F
MHRNISLSELEHLLEFAPCVLYKYVLFPNGEGSLLYVSAGSTDLLGLHAKDMVDDIDNFWNIVYPIDLERLQAEDNSANQQGDFFVSDVRINNPAKGMIWVRLSSKPSDEFYEGHQVWTGYMVDITDTKRLEAELEERARRDAMTQLWNKSEIVSALGDALSRFERDNQPFSIMLMDLDHFKAINDNYGHLVGDDVLLKFTEIASSELREVDILGRFGGEEFLAIIHNASQEETRVLAERIRQTVEKTYFTEDTITFSITVSIGITEIKKIQKQSPEEVIRRADDALYQAKQDGRNTIRFK